ncbi:MAG: DNA polymerase IV [Eubacteriales bacterium]
MKNNQLDRKILHCDMNNFFASVELLSLPELANFPVAVCGNPEERKGIILAKNNLAKKAGVVTAETIWSAKKKCPTLRLIPPHYDKYKEYSKLINQIYYRYTDLIEPFSIDESWLDVSDSTVLFGDAQHIANSIRSTVKSELGLTLSIGVSFNKIFAKMGSEYKKPDATTIISRENFRQILWPLPVGEFFFVGKASAKKLEGLGIKTIGALAHADGTAVSTLLGKSGLALIAYANGFADANVKPYGQTELPKSISHAITFARNLSRRDEVSAALRNLADMVAFRLRRKALYANAIKLEIKDPHFQVSSHQKKLFTSTNSTDEIYETALTLYKTFPKRPKSIRLFSLAALNLTPVKESEQLSFFDAPDFEKEKGARLDFAIDSIRNKFGASLVQYASNIHQNED